MAGTLWLVRSHYSRTRRGRSHHGRPSTAKQCRPMQILTDQCNINQAEPGSGRHSRSRRFVVNQVESIRSTLGLVTPQQAWHLGSGRIGLNHVTSQQANPSMTAFSEPIRVEAGAAPRSSPGLVVPNRVTLRLGPWQVWRSSVGPVAAGHGGSRHGRHTSSSQVPDKPRRVRLSQCPLRHGRLALSYLCKPDRDKLLRSAPLLVLAALA